MGPLNIHIIRNRMQTKGLRRMDMHLVRHTCARDNAAYAKLVRGIHVAQFLFLQNELQPNMCDDLKCSNVRHSHDVRVFMIGFCTSQEPNGSMVNHVFGLFFNVWEQL